MENRNIYLRAGNILTFKGTTMGRNAEDVITRFSRVKKLDPGNYIVTNLDFTEITKVNVTLTATAE